MMRTLLTLLATCGSVPLVGAQSRVADHIVAVINREVVTASEMQQRLERTRVEAERAKVPLPPDTILRKQVLDALIDERVIISMARDSGQRVEEAEIDRATANVAAQNQVPMDQLRERLRREGIDYGRFRANLRDQILVERMREKEVQSRIRISDAEIDDFLQQQTKVATGTVEMNLAQILLPVPEGASEAVVGQWRSRAESAIARIRAGEAFDVVAKELSQDSNRERGGEIGMRPIDRLPDVFVDAVKTLQPGQITPVPLRTGAGFHVLKLIEHKQGSPFNVMQTRARHILLRTSAQLSQQAAIGRLAGFKRQIDGGTRNFEALARDNSEDGSAANGGDLGWTSAGSFVPEFEQAMNALPIGGVSDPVVSRFGVHLIQVMERRSVALEPKQMREQARNALREQKFDAAYEDWVTELRARAYIELREPPL